MQPQTLDTRVERLEHRMTAIEQLPVRVDALAWQISQVREEMHAEFSALRSEIGTGDEETRRSLREEIRAGDEETRRSLREEIRAVHEGLRSAIGDLPTKSQMLVLHEDLVSKLALTEEAGSPKTRRRRRR